MYLLRGWGIGPECHVIKGSRGCTAGPLWGEGIGIVVPIFMVVIIAMVRTASVDLDLSALADTCAPDSRTTQQAGAALQWQSQGLNK